MKRFQPFHSQKAGFQCYLEQTTKTKKGYSISAPKLRIRAFSHENGREQVNVYLNFIEVAYLAEITRKLMLTQGKSKETPIVHKSQRNRQESTASITIEKFKEGKLAFVFKRDNTSINVPLSYKEALAFIQLLKALFPEIAEEISEKISGSQIEPNRKIEEAPF